MSNANTRTITGDFEYLIYSPPGNIEGFLLRVDGRPIQIVFEAFQPEVYEPLLSVEKGQQVSLEATAQSPAKKGEAAHPVYDLVQLTSPGIRPIDESDQAEDSGYVGKVVRINYAKHGEPNGVVLDSGDFIHMKPKGFAQLKLKVGSAVQADGDAHMLVTNTGWAVEARTVNGVELG